MPKKTKSPEGKADKQIKFYATEVFRQEVERFHAQHPELGSMTDFGRAAFKFYMEKYREAGFIRDHNDFPSPPASSGDGHESHNKLRPLRRPKGA